MKKRVLTILSLPLLLASCSVKHEAAIKKITTSDPEIICLSQSQLETLVNSKAAFSLVVSKNECHLCHDFGEIVSDYIVQEQTLIFSYTVQQNELPTLIEKMPGVFSEQSVSPSFYIINNSSVTYDMDYSHMKKYSAFKRTANTLYKDSMLYYESDINRAKSTISNEDFTMLIYDSSNVNSFETFSKAMELMQHNTYKQKTIIFDKKEANSQLFFETFNFSFRSDSDEIVKIKKGEFSESTIVNKDNIDSILLG